MVIQDVTSGREDREAHDQCTSAVGEVDCDLRVPMRRNQLTEHEREVRYRQSCTGVAHRRAHDDLQIDQPGRDRGHPLQHEVVWCRSLSTGTPQRRSFLGRVAALPPRRRDQRDRHRQTEDDLREARVRDRNRIRQIPQHRDAAEDALSDHGSEREIAEPAHPTACLRTPEPRREHEDEESNRAGDQSMRVLVPDPAHHLLEREEEHEVAVGVRPVWHRQTRLGARDEAAREDQDAGDCCHQHREEMKHHTLKTNEIFFDSLGPIVIFCVCAPSFSCQASIVYVPGGSPASAKAPALPLTA